MNWKSVYQMLLWALCLSIHAASAQSPSFVEPPALQRMEAARKVQITHIGWMRITPKMIDDNDWQRSSRPMRAEDVASLLRNAGKSARLEKAPTLARCSFAPGFQVSFFDAEDKISETLLICLNCDVLAVGDRSRLGNVLPPRPASGPGGASDGLPARYGDAGPYKAELITLLKNYFPEEMEKWQGHK